MHAFTTRVAVRRGLWLLLLCAGAGEAIATPNIGVLIDNWCTKAPLQSAAPQQSRPYTAAGSACTLCHTSTPPTLNNLNARGIATRSCSGSGTATICGTEVNPYCVATPPTPSIILSPPVGTSVTLGQSVTFQAGGTSSSPDGFVLSYTWLFSGGQASASGFQVIVPMTVAGAITSTLQVRNTVGMLATGTPPTRVVTVTSGTGNQPPVATISAPATNVAIAAGGTVNFQGSGTDPDNNLPLTYQWVFAGGTPASSTAQNPGAVTYNTAGTFTASFTVIDSLGLASAAVTRTVTVTGGTGNQPPVATIRSPAGNVTIAAGGTVNFRGSGTDPDNNLPLTYSWVFNGGTPASSAVRSPGAVTYSTGGTYTASFTVIDSLGLASAAVTRTVTVTGGTGNQPPVATISAPAADVSIAVGGTVNFQGSGTDPDNNLPLTYRWVFAGGTPASSTVQNPGAVTYSAAGTFTASFTVIDSRGLASAAVTRVVTVASVSQVPIASIDVPTINVSVLPGGAVTFRGSGVSAANLPLSFRWTFAGGSPSSSTSQNPGTVQFRTVGSFTVTLVVTDSAGHRSAPVTRVVTVAAANQRAPTIRSCNAGTNPGDD